MKHFRLFTTRQVWKTVMLFSLDRSCLEHNKKKLFSIESCPAACADQISSERVQFISEQKRAEYKTEQLGIPGLSSTWLA